MPLLPQTLTPFRIGRACAPTGPAHRIVRLANARGLAHIMWVWQVTDHRQRHCPPLERSAHVALRLPVCGCLVVYAPRVPVISPPVFPFVSLSRLHAFRLCTPLPLRD